MRTFRQTPVDLIQTELSERWGHGVALRRLGGYLGRSEVFEVLHEGRVLKVFHHRAARACRRESTVCKLLGGGPLPIARFVDQATFSDGEPWLCMERLPGVVLEGARQRLDEAAAPSLYRAMGELCGRLHSVPVTRLKRLGSVDRQRKYGKSRAEILRRRLPDAALFVRADARMSVLEQDDAVSRYRRAAIHGDFSSRNVLVSGTGRDARITGLIDFELARIADPAEDLAMFALKEFSGPADLKRAFLAGYRDAGRCGSLDEKRFAYHLLGLVFNIADWAWEDDRAFHAHAVRTLELFLSGDEMFRLR